MSFRVSSAVSDLHAADAIGTTETVIPGSTQTIKPSQSTGSSSTQDNCLRMLVDEMLSNKTRMWNSVELHERYIELGRGRQMAT